MGIDYSPSAIRILELLGYAPVAKKIVEEFEQTNKIILPRIFSKFLEYIIQNPLFSTADIWSTRDPYSFYSELEQLIEEDKETWAKNPEEYEDDEYYQLSQVPKEEWMDYIDDLLLIGSDYGAGIVTFGIDINEFDEEDPAVYIRNEANSIQDWELLSESLSEFLKMTVCDVLSCIEYPTAQEVLEKSGWKYHVYKDPNTAFKLLMEKSINLTEMETFPSIYESVQEVCCCYDDSENTLYVIRNDLKNYKMCVISKQ